MVEPDSPRTSERECVHSCLRRGSLVLSHWSLECHSPRTRTKDQDSAPILDRSCRIRVSERSLAPSSSRASACLAEPNVRMTLLPSADDSGLVFERVDLPGRPRIPARIEYLVAEPRRTVARLWCRSRRKWPSKSWPPLAGAEDRQLPHPAGRSGAPCGDGFLARNRGSDSYAGIAEQSAPRRKVVVREGHSIAEPGERGSRASGPRRTLEYPLRPGLRNMVIRPQSFQATITPEEFVREIAFAGRLSWSPKSRC